MSDPNDPNNFKAAIADLTERIAAAKANGDTDLLNKLADMEQHLHDQLSQLNVLV